jgi:ribonuclease P protein component
MDARSWPGVVQRAARNSSRSDCARLVSNGAARLRLPAERRIRRKSEFDAAYAHGQRLGNGFFAVTVYSHPADVQRSALGGEQMVARRNDLAKVTGSRVGGPRIGLAVAVRIAGGSVQRNRIRRVIRESFRLHQHELPAADFVVSARARSRGASGPELHAALDALWKKVTGVCAKSPLS